MSVPPKVMQQLSGINSILFFSGEILSLAGLGAAGLKLVTSAPLGIVSDKAMYVEEAEIAVEKKRRRGKGLASATSAALTPPITRRHSFDVGELENRLTRPKLTMFHELRAYFDPEYRLHMVKRDILKFCRELDLGVEDMFNMVDEDGSGILDREEMTAMIKKLGILVKEVEIDTLMEKLDADGSGGIEVDEFDRWLFNTSDIPFRFHLRVPGDGTQLSPCWCSAPRTTTWRLTEPRVKVAAIY